MREDWRWRRREASAPPSSCALVARLCSWGIRQGHPDWHVCRGGMYVSLHHSAISEDAAVPDKKNPMDGQRTS